MIDTFIGLVAGIITMTALIHLIYQKRLTTKGWVGKTENPSKYWLHTSLFSFSAITIILYMVYF